MITGYVIAGIAAVATTAAAVSTFVQHTGTAAGELARETRTIAELATLRTSFDAALRRDANGRLVPVSRTEAADIPTNWLYCPWRYQLGATPAAGSGLDSQGYRTLSRDIVPGLPTYAILEPGKNRRLETSCSDLEATLSPHGELAVQGDDKVLVGARHTGAAHFSTDQPSVLNGQPQRMYDGMLVVHNTGTAVEAGWKSAGTPSLQPLAAATASSAPENEIVCPAGGWVEVPSYVPPSGRAVPPFCVMDKAVANTNGTPATLRPWDALGACQVRGYDLMTDRQYLSLAHQLLTEDANYLAGDFVDGPASGELEAAPGGLWAPVDGGTGREGVKPGAPANVTRLVKLKGKPLWDVMSPTGTTVRVSELLQQASSTVNKLSYTVQRFPDWAAHAKVRAARDRSVTPSGAPKVEFGLLSVYDEGTTGISTSSRRLQFFANVGQRLSSTPRLQFTLLNGWGLPSTNDAAFTAGLARCVFAPYGDGGRQ